jgi:site-specific recombinase XerD
MARLTKRTVEAAPVRERDYVLWCDDLPGFGCRIWTSGKRSYCVQYRAAGRSRRATIGLHGHLTAEEARKQAMALLGEVAKGGDPAEERATRRASLTVRELCDRYRTAADNGLIHGKRGPKRPLTLASDWGRIDGHIVPLLGKKLVRDLTHSDVARFVRDVAAGKTAREGTATGKLRGKSIVRGGQGVAARAAALLGGILTFAVSEGVIPTNPVHGVRKPPYQRRTARLTPEDYGKLGKALAAAEGEGINTTALAIVRLLALTGCRKNEVVALRWAEVDRPGQALRLAETKEGASVRPAGAAALAILADLPRKEGAEWVFPGERRDAPYGGMKGAWRQILGLSGLEGVTPHTLRHSFASVAGDLGFSESTIAALLGHAAGSVTSRYVHRLDSVLIAAADRVAEKIEAYMRS